MEIKSQICTSVEQSERLIALGLKKETADCRWIGLVKDAKGRDIPKKKQIWCLRASESEEAMVCGFMKHSFIPSWSLHRLIAMLPNTVNRPMYYLKINNTEVEYSRIDYTEYGINHYTFNEKECLYDNIIACMEWTIKNNFFNKEYLI